MKKFIALIVVSLSLVAVHSSAMADGHEAKIQKYVDSNIRGWLASEELHRAIYQQNLNHMGLTATDINNLDQQWRAERRVGGRDLVSSRMINHVSSFFAGYQGGLKRRDY